MNTIIIVAVIWVAIMGLIVGWNYCASVVSNGPKPHDD